MWPQASYKTRIYIPDFKMRAIRFLSQSIFQNGSFDEMLAIFIVMRTIKLN